ncbi:MAG: DUF5107 domain-containing protein [Oscillospiraceae bacterium]|nr:DUF5107 domain-containing protein [Oscillospiraceae bacterium]
MKTTCRFDRLTLPSAHLGPESDMPSILSEFNLQSAKSALLDEEDELFTDLGRIRSIYPYRQQSLYDRAEEEISHPTAILENEFLRAEFLLDHGGRLWSLFDKKAKRELLYRNDVLRYCNLALRNAWFSGGVEWNLGMVGHTPFTCEPIFVSTLEASDGTPILRMYEYERLRGVTYQMDFSLPEESEFLLCRMRILNLHDKTIPMYWWSNIAVPEETKRRTVVPADSSYYSAWLHIAKTDIPKRWGKDVSYSLNTPCSMDYFYRLGEEGRKYVASLDETGYGLVQTSTRRLKGRKLFVWGNSVGGGTWQKFLTKNAGPYAEIQAGLGRTQYECIPMPPLCAWEWMEAYGPISLQPEIAHGEWMQAREGVEENLDRRLDRLAMEEMLLQTKKDYAIRPGRLVQTGSGYGALENARREKEGLPKISEHLDFGSCGEKQADWMALLEGNFPNPDPQKVPVSDLCGSSWMKYVSAAEEKDPGNWYIHYVKGLLCLEGLDETSAQKAFETSLSCAENPWAEYGLAACALAKGEREKAIIHLKKAYDQRPDDICLAKDLGKQLETIGAFEDLKAFCLALPEQVKQVGKMKLYLASAKAHLGELEEAEEMLCGGDGLSVPDIREGETSLTALWFYIMRAKEKKEGKEPAERLTPPAHLDFRMGSAPEDPMPYDETIG